MTIEKMKQWLEALEVVNICIDDYYLPKEKAWLPEIEQAIASLRQAISEAEGQEKALQALHTENERLGLYKDAYAEQGPDKYAIDIECTKCGAQQSGILTVHTTPPQHTEQKPVIDKSAAIRIATALGWEPKREWVGLKDEEIQNIAFDAADRESAIIQAESKLAQKNGY